MYILLSPTETYAQYTIISQMSESRQKWENYQHRDLQKCNVANELLLCLQINNSGRSYSAVYVTFLPEV
jgi:hypothetical protein